jgi:hypothetical protein
MPSVRKSTGRAVTPVRQPEVAAARQTQLTPPPDVAFPVPPGLHIPVEGAPQVLARALDRPQALALPLTRLAPPEMTTPASRIEVAEPARKVAIEFPAVTVGNLRWPRPGSPGAGFADPEFPAATTLRAALSPGLFEQEAEYGAFPSPPRQDQLETVQRLVGGGDWLLTQDPGIGLEETACLALRELFRARQAGCALLVVPGPMQRAWRSRLEVWGPPVEVRTGVAGEHGAQGGAPHLHLVDFGAAEAAAEALGQVDVVVIDAYAAFRRRGGDPTALTRLSPGRRWVLSGGAPPEAEDWRLLNRFFHPNWGGTSALADIHEKLRGRTIRQTREALADVLPRRARREIWFDLEGEQRAAYDRWLEEERRRLSRLGGAVNRTHIEGSLGRLKQALAFLPGGLDGVKVRALVDLSEEILASGAKLLVVTPPGETMLESLLAVLESHGAVRLDSRAPSEEQAAALEAFRRPSGPRVLLADSEARGDGEPLQGATYLIHFSHEWNPAHRRRAEQRLFPDLGPGPPHTVFEFWVAETVEQAYHALLEAQGLLAGDVGHATRPSELEERLTLDDWLRRVFEVDAAGGTQKRAATGKLPGTGALRETWKQFSAQDLAQAAEALMRALGFTQVEPLATPVAAGCDFAAWQVTEAGAERSFVRCLRLDEPADVAHLDEARRAMEGQPDCSGCLLITTADFTPAARQAAEASGGALTLVDGSEFYRHLRVLGLVG